MRAENEAGGLCSRAQPNPTLQTASKVVDSARGGLRLLNLLIVVMGLSLGSGACSSAPRSAKSPEPAPTPAEQAPSEVGPPEPYGPAPSETPVPAAPSYGPSPVRLKPVVLVLGAGAARSFAHVGVIKALVEAKVPIGAVVATDLGALIGALYAVNPTINELEWALLQFKEEAFLKGETLFQVFGRGPSDGSELEAALDKTLGAKTFRDSRIPLKIVVRFERSGRAGVVDDGRLDRVVRASAAIRGLMTPGLVSGEAAASAAESRPYPVAEAKRIGLGPVVAVDLLADAPVAAPGQGRRGALVSELRKRLDLAGKNGARALRDADIVIRPELGDIGYLDYSKRTEAAFRGRKALNASLKEIRRQVGMAQAAERDGSGENYE